MCSFFCEKGELPDNLWLVRESLISRVSCASVKNIALSWAEIRTDISFIAVSFKSYYMLG